MLTPRDKQADGARTAGIPEATQARSAPIGLGYDAQTAALRPPPGSAPRAEGAALRIEAGAGTANAVANAVAAPAAPPVALVDDLHRHAYDWLRTRAYSIAWMAALQAKLGVAPTGVADVATVNAILTKHPIAEPVAKKKVSASVRAQLLEAAVVKGMSATMRVLGAEVTTKDLPERAAATGLGKAGGSHGAGKDTPEEVAFASAHGGYAGFVSTQLKTGTFLGKTVVAHPDFHDRLANAAAYLRSKHPAGTTDEQIAEALGIRKVVSFRPTTADFDQMYHGIGFAIDLNPEQNNWHIGRGDNTWQLNRILGRVNQLFGATEVRSALGMAANSKKLATEGAYEAIAKANTQLRRYRELANDRGQLEAYLASASCPENVRKLGVAHWARVLAEDEKVMARTSAKQGGLMGPDGKPDHSSGFMDLKLLAVQAMRDAAGLRWGGTDLGGDSGDLMHFDGGFMNSAVTLRSKVQKARHELSAAKAKVGESAEKTPE